MASLVNYVLVYVFPYFTVAPTLAVEYVPATNSSSSHTSAHTGRNLFVQPFFQTFSMFFSLIAVIVRARLHAPQQISWDNRPDPTTFEWQGNLLIPR